MKVTIIRQQDGQQLGFAKIEGEHVGCFGADGKRLPRKHTSDWRFIHVADGVQRIVGKAYPLRCLLIADSDRYATEFGFK